MATIFTKYQLRVLSALTSNFCVVWVAASFIAEDRFSLFSNLFLGIFALLGALFFEKQLESYGN